jgi:hypothetical protein
VAKYNIELRTEKTVSEALVVESDDHTALRVEVAQFVGQLLKDHAGKIWADEDWRVDVTDERGLILYVMHIAAIQAAAVGGSRLSEKARQPAKS